jgi:hypothetical protein
VIHGRQSVYDLFTIIWTQWFSKWRRTCTGFDEEIEEHLWHIEVGFGSQYWGRRNQIIGSFDETGWLPQRYVSDLCHCTQSNPVTYGAYEHMGPARNIKVGNMGLELEDIRLDICYDYGSSTEAHLQVIKIEHAQQQT